MCPRMSRKCCPFQLCMPICCCTTGRPAGALQSPCPPDPCKQAPLAGISLPTTASADWLTGCTSKSSTMPPNRRQSYHEQLPAQQREVGSCGARSTEAIGPCCRKGSQSLVLLNHVHPLAPPCVAIIGCTCVPGLSSTTPMPSQVLLGTVANSRNRLLDEQHKQTMIQRRAAV